MSKKSTRKYGVYNALEIALRKTGFENSGSLTTLLLETFLEHDGLLTARKVKNAGLCEDEGFKAWRDPLIREGWLEYNHELAKVSKKGSLHQAGKMLIPYLNREKVKSHSLVTENQLYRSIAPLQARMDAMEDFLRGVIEDGDPPYTEEKGKSYLADPKAFVRVVRGGRIRDEEGNDEQVFIKN